MRKVRWSVAASIAVYLVTLVPPAAADHTKPREPITPTDGAVVPVTPNMVRGEGTWTHIANFPAVTGEALTGGGTDLEFWAVARPGLNDLYGAFGTLGQDQGGSIGQRIIRLISRGQVQPTWLADHGSAHCQANASVTGLQHDPQIARLNGIHLLTDTTDASGRCHDTGGGGIEIVDVSKMHEPAFEPREVHLLRLFGFSHTHTVDSLRKWIVYNSSSDFSVSGCNSSTEDCGNWIDVIDIRTCFGTASSTLEQRRATCRPKVYRIRFQEQWTEQRDQTTGQLEPGSAACHDITSAGSRLYCASPNATLILETSGLFDSAGNVKGEPLPCTLIPTGTGTGASVTDCGAMGRTRTEQAIGWRFLDTFNHPGRDCVPAIDQRTCNSNNFVRSDEGIAVAHEADPTADRQFMFVTDERGGGVVPPGSSCTPGVDNPFGNGGAHAFQIKPVSDIKYATTPGGAKSVYISDAVVPAETFCDIHVIELVPGEQRFIAAYYTQGIKIVDYFVDSAGHVTFLERASFTLPSANTWAAEQFKLVKNTDGSVTYFIGVNDISRGIDVVKWTGPRNPIGAPPPATSSSTAAMNIGLLGLAALLLPAAAAYGRRRRRLEGDS